MNLERVRFPLLLTVLFAAAWFVSAWAGARADADLEARGEPTLAQYDSATVRVDGILSPSASAALGDGEFVLVVLRKRDVLVCEDLGRQLREVVAGRAGLPMKVAIDDSSLAVVSGFLRRERIAAAVVPIPAQQVVDSYSALPTPAVLLVANRHITAGVAHPTRFTNARLRSFHEELEVVARGEGIGSRNPTQERGS